MDNLNESSEGPIFLWELNSMKFVLSTLRVGLLAENQSATRVSSVYIYDLSKGLQRTVRVKNVGVICKLKKIYNRIKHRLESV